MIDQLTLFIILSLISEILGTIGGFGSSVFFVPIANYFLDFQSVLGITALFHLSSNLTKIAAFRSGLDRRLVLLIGLPAVLTVSIGAWLTAYVDQVVLELSLSLFLIILSLIFLILRRFQLKATNRNSIIGGSLSGFLAGVLGTGGAIRGLTLSAFNLEKQVFIATSAVIDLCIDLSRSVVYFFNGFIHQHDLYLLPFLLIASIAGTLIGKQILKQLNQDQFRKLVLYLILGIGMVTLFSVI